MTRQELMDLHGTTCNKAFSIMEAKNADYTGGSDDPFANFRATEMLGVPAEIGILTRCLDKFQRIRSFTINGTLAVKGESVDDAIEDVINYMVLLKGVIKDRVGEISALENLAIQNEAYKEALLGTLDKPEETNGQGSPKFRSYEPIEGAIGPIIENETPRPHHYGQPCGCGEGDCPRDKESTYTQALRGTEFPRTTNALKPCEKGGE